MKQNRINNLLVLLLTLIAVFVSCISYAGDTIITGTVKRVLDGDTIHLMSDSIPIVGAKTHKDGTVSVRFRGIDAPEKRQPFGLEAKANLENLIEQKTVKIAVKDIDRYGRIAGYVYLNNKNINLEQVKAGYAWAYSEYLDRPYASEFYKAERQARKDKKGLWQQANPQAPWEWRKNKR